MGFGQASPLVCGTSALPGNIVCLLQGEEGEVWPKAQLRGAISNYLFVYARLVPKR
jgi:hypothetical protein